MNDEPTLLRIIERERLARRQAEELLEAKNRELFQVNQHLTHTMVALDVEAAKLRAVLQTAAEAILTFDSQGRIQSANPAAEQVFGYSRDELIGQHVQMLLPSSNERAPILDESFWTGTEDSGDRRHVLGRRKDGTEFEMELSGSRVRIDNHWLHTWFFRDVTQRRNLERQLAFAQKMESVGRLAAGIAHEINTPIQYIGHNTAFLESAIDIVQDVLDRYEKLRTACEPFPQLAQQAAELAEFIKSVNLEFMQQEIPHALQQTAEGTHRVAQIVSAMKEFSHPGTRDKTYINLNSAVESTVTISRNEWKYVAQVELALEPDLPKLLCHPGDVNQAILNLIVNAAHAIETRYGQGPSGRITISTRCDGDSIEIRIRDNGTGIPQELLNKIYDPFFTTKAQGKGTGQGLALVYSTIVERHGGTIDLDTEPGEGTTFTLRLPLQEAASEKGGICVAANPVCR